VTARRIVEEVSKGPLGRLEWTDAECDYVSCPLRNDVERIETSNGNVMLVVIGALIVGAVIGFGIGKLS
jgi:hypothetical protein